MNRRDSIYLYRNCSEKNNLNVVLVTNNDHNISSLNSHSHRRTYVIFYVELSGYRLLPTDKKE